MAVLSGIQRNTATIANGSSSVTVSITPIDRTKSILLFGFSKVGNSAPTDDCIRGQLTADGQIVFARTGTVNAVTINWQVITFSSGVTVQRGTSNFGKFQADTDIAINPVNLGKAVVFQTVAQLGGLADYDDMQRIYFADNSTIRISLPVDTVNVDKISDWQVVEFEDASVTSGSYSIGATTTSGTATVPALDPAKTLLFHSYSVNPGSGFVANRNAVRGRITDSTTLTFDRFAGDSVPITGHYFLASFSDNTVVQHGTGAYSSTQGTQTVTLTEAVDQSASIILGGLLGTTRTTNTGSDNMAFPIHRMSFGSDTTITGVRGATGSTTEFTYSVATFSTEGGPVSVTPTGISATAAIGQGQGVSSNLSDSAEVVGLEAVSAIKAPAVLSDNAPTTLESLQKGFTTIASGTNSSVVTITEVDLSRSVLLFSIRGAGTGVTAYDMVRGQLTGATEITLRRHSNDTSTIEIEWQVLTFMTGVKVQRGTTVLSGTANLTSVDISAVDLTKAVVIATVSNNGSFTGFNDLVRAKFNSATQIGLERTALNDFAVADWQVIEFVRSTVHSGEYLMGTTEVAKLITLPSVDLSKTLVFHSYMGGADTTKPYYACLYARMTQPTLLTVARNSALGQAMTGTYFVVTFDDATSVQAGTVSFSSEELTKNVPLTTPVSPATTGLIGGYPYSQSYSWLSSDDLFMQASATIRLLNTDTLTIVRGASGSDLQQTWQAVTFQEYVPAVIGEPDTPPLAGQVGSVTIAAEFDTDVGVLGVTATATIRSPNIRMPRGAEPTGVSATAILGAALAVAITNGRAIATGVSSQGRVGTPTPKYGGSLVVNSTAATTRLGNVQITDIVKVNATATPTGVRGKGYPGPSTILSDESSGEFTDEFTEEFGDYIGEAISVGVVMPALEASLGNENVINTMGVTVTFTGNQAKVSPGTVSITNVSATVVRPTNVTGTARLGVGKTTASTAVTATGVSAQGSLGLFNAADTLTITVNLTGVGATTGLGEQTTEHGTGVKLKGVSALTGTGQIQQHFDCHVEWEALWMEASGKVGKVLAYTDERVPINLPSIWHYVKMRS